MDKQSPLYQNCLHLLRTELVPALGCTEPIAIAYGAAKAAQVLGRLPDRIEVACSGSIIKNAKSVIVPGTKDLHGISASAILGAFFGDAGKEMEVLGGIRDADVAVCRDLLRQNICTVRRLETTHNLHLIVTLRAAEQSAQVEVRDTHTGIVSITKDGIAVPHSVSAAPAEEAAPAGAFLTMADIYAFAATCDLADVRELLTRQIDCNWKIAEEGLAHSYGASVGITLLEEPGRSDPRLLARAYAAAGSDARMGGCQLPVIINSGSGNQGMTVSLPVIVYARHLRRSEDDLLRALLLSNLTALYQKAGIGRLSAYCGAVSAAGGVSAAVTYLLRGDYRQICMAVTNTIATLSGMFCDGAKASCAAKISAAVDTAILASQMAMQNRSFCPGDGIVQGSLDETIHGIGHLASSGMRTADAEILKIMVAQE